MSFCFENIVAKASISCFFFVGFVATFRLNNTDQFIHFGFVVNNAKTSIVYLLGLTL